jgi:hypothetical protein
MIRKSGFATQRSESGPCKKESGDRQELSPVTDNGATPPRASIWLFMGGRRLVGRNEGRCGTLYAL